MIPRGGGRRIHQSDRELENGDTWLTYPGSGGFGGVTRGTLTSGGGVFAGELRNYDFSKDRQSTVAVTGTFEPGRTLKGSAVVEGEVVTLTRRYATDYDRPASAFIATGTWEVFYACCGQGTSAERTAPPR